MKNIAGIRLPERGEDRQDTVRLDPSLARDGGEIKYSVNSKSLMVRVPAGIRDGQRIRLKGMGTPGKAGGEPGDLYLLIKIKKSLVRKLKDIFNP